MATYGGGVSPSAVGAKIPFAPAVVSPIATCAGGVFSSTHWRRYQTYTQATCTAWWWFFGGGGGGGIYIYIYLYLSPKWRRSESLDLLSLKSF